MPSDTAQTEAKMLKAHTAGTQGPGWPAVYLARSCRLTLRAQRPGARPVCMPSNRRRVGLSGRSATQGKEQEGHLPYWDDGRKRRLWVGDAVVP